MDNREFHALADSWLAGFLDIIEAADRSGALEADLIESVLTIRLPDGRAWIVNKHSPTGQIWLASPLSGAQRFSYGGEAWRNNKGEELGAKLAAELKEYYVF